MCRGPRGCKGQAGQVVLGDCKGARPTSTRPAAGPIACTRDRVREHGHILAIIGVFAIGVHLTSSRLVLYACCDDHRGSTAASSVAAPYCTRHERGLSLIAGVSSGAALFLFAEQQQCEPRLTPVLTWRRPAQLHATAFRSAGESQTTRYGAAAIRGGPSGSSTAATSTRQRSLCACGDDVARSRARVRARRAGGDPCRIFSARRRPEQQPHSSVQKCCCGWRKQRFCSTPRTATRCAPD